MKNKYYDDFATFRKAVELFFQNFSQYKDQLKKLLNFKFGIIKQFSINEQSYLFQGIRHKYYPF